MSPSVMTYLLGMAVLFVAQRLLDGFDGAQWTGTVAGLVLLGAAAALRFGALRSAKGDGLRLGHRLALMLLMLGVGSLVLYAGTSDGVVRGLAMEDEAEKRWMGVWGSIWPALWVIGTVPMVVVDWALQSSPVMVPTVRIRHAVGHGLIAAMGICLIFPINFLATQHNERWDLAYFKTPEPGGRTHALVENLENPVDVRIFLPASSEVAQELTAYFSHIEGPNIRVSVMDQAAVPKLAKKLLVRKNGLVALTVGEVVLDDEQAAEDPDAPKPVTKLITVGDDFDKAKRTLRKFDGEVQKVLAEIGQGERVVYLTKGHGELTWDGQQVPLDRKITGLKKFLPILGFKIKRLGPTDGLGDAIPDDADLVMVLGPDQPFLANEVDALRKFVQGGGALVVSFEPSFSKQYQKLADVGDPLVDFIAELGVKPAEGILAAERNTAMVTGGKIDRFNILSINFASHPSTKIVGNKALQLFLFTPAAGYLENTGEHGNSVTMTVNTLPIVWADLNGNAEFDGDAGETKDSRPVVATIAGGEGDTAFRVMVTGDASLWSDLGLGNKGNQQFVSDGLNWLVGAEALSGTTESEEDVKIEHTKEGQTAWFYSTVLGVPLLIVGLGVIRVRLRRRGGAK